MRFTVNPFSKRLDAFEANQGPTGDIEFIKGDTGGNIPPNGSNVINLIGDPNQGFAIKGTIATNTLLVTDITVKEGVVTSNDDTVTDVVSVSLGAIAGCYTFNLIISGYEPLTNSGVSFTGTASYKSDGAGATEIATEINNPRLDAALSTVNIFATISGNNAVFQIQGIIGKTIDWRVWTKYIKA